MTDPQAVAAPRTDAGREHLDSLMNMYGRLVPDGDRITVGATRDVAAAAIRAIEAEAAASAGSLDVHDLLMKGAEIGYTYGALGRDFAQVLPEVRRLTRQSSEPEEAS